MTLPVIEIGTWSRIFRKSSKMFNLYRSSKRRDIILASLQVVELARKYDPDGIRTLGVVTKCDDAARAEASDVVEKAGPV